MITERSPLEFLAAFSICFAAGFAMKLVMDAWAKRVKGDAQTNHHTCPPQG